MKLGVFTPVLYHMPLEDALRYLNSKGVEMAEIGCGGYPGTNHCNPDILLKDEKAFKEFTSLFEKYNIKISAISCHANPVHPDKKIAAKFDKAITDGILMAEKLGINQINTFSGCPGDCDNSKYPNWVTCPWPEDFTKILDYQWNEVLIPYWKEKVKLAKAHNINKIGLELHPGFCVYNTDSLFRLREAVGEEIGANLDPSHLIWQGMDPVVVIKKLGSAIFHFHAKDTQIDKYNTAVTGVLDTKHYGDEKNRSWIFRTVGYGLSEIQWKDILGALRLVGYDYAISIEHEDSLMSPLEGLDKAIDFLKNILLKDAAGEMWWA